MTYKRTPAGHTEFGGGPGLVDPERRKDRALEPHEELWEIYATNPMDPEADPATSDLEYIPRPKPVEWADPKTAKGTT